MQMHRITILSLFVISLMPLPFKRLDAQGEENLAPTKPGNFGTQWSMTRKMYDYILKLLPEGSTLVELGSGWASGELSKHYNVWSVEHDETWLGKYNTHYIYAPIVDKWYSRTHLKEQLPASYDLIIVDGPPGKIGRRKFFDNLDLFKTNVIIIFDDVARRAEYDLMVKVANHLGRPFKVVSDDEEKKFGVILSH